MQRRQSLDLSANYMCDILKLKFNALFVVLTGCYMHIRLI